MRTHGSLDPHPYILSAAKQLDWVRYGAKVQVRHNYNRKKNLESFGDLFIRRTAPPPSGSIHHEDPVLQ